MTTAPRAVLHIGAPKCGSSALQTALSQTPRLNGPGGAFHYVAMVPRAGGVQRLEGRAVRWAARGSAYGYLACPNLPRTGDGSEVFPALETLLTRAPRPWRRSCPILSSEGWIAHPQAFGALLSRLGNPPVTVMAYVRPPLDWLNAAYWQWGLWSGRSFGEWYARSKMQYNMGTLLGAWAAIPGVSLKIRTTGGDVISSFAEDLGVDLPAPSRANSASAPALVGFLLRNREAFRPNPHAAANEFVVQRWCPDLPRRPLWALNHVDVQNVRSENMPEMRRLIALMPGAGLDEDPLWVGEAPYHDRIREGRTFLRDLDELARLFEALVAGLDRALAATGGRRPDLPAAPGPGAELEEWDAAIAPVLGALIETDRVWRLGQGVGRGLAWLGARLGLERRG